MQLFHRNVSGIGLRCHSPVQIGKVIGMDCGCKLSSASLLVDPLLLWVLHDFGMTVVMLLGELVGRE